MLTKNNDYIIFGVLTRAHGLKGELRLLPFFDDPSFFTKVTDVALIRDEAIQGIFTVQARRPHKKFILIKLENIDTFEATAPFIKSEVGISPQFMPPLEKGEFYVEDIIGFNVMDENAREYGNIKQVHYTASHDIYEVLDQQTGQELLLPAIRDFITNIDFDAHQVIIKKPSYL